ncbi:hypothetical protein, partial [Microvirga roseola]|uniref:hypothetical protein n=1 Tax=Microvirga roseola TaxID=2883126 RepID=UPI001E3354BC
MYSPLELAYLEYVFGGASSSVPSMLRAVLTSGAPVNVGTTTTHTSGSATNAGVPPKMSERGNGLTATTTHAGTTTKTTVHHNGGRSQVSTSLADNGVVTIVDTYVTPDKSTTYTSTTTRVGIFNSTGNATGWVDTTRIECLFENVAEGRIGVM